MFKRVAARRLASCYDSSIKARVGTIQECGDYDFANPMRCHCARTDGKGVDEEAADGKLRVAHRRLRIRTTKNCARSLPAAATKALDREN